jgi:hypothetical protein
MAARTRLLISALARTGRRVLVPGQVPRTRCAPPARPAAARHHVLVGEQAEHLALLLAGQQAVLVLHGDERGPAEGGGGVLHLGEAPSPHPMRRRGSAPCRPSPRRAPFPWSRQRGRQGRSGGSGADRRSRCRVGAATRRPVRGSPCATVLSRRAGVHGPEHLGRQDDLLARRELLDGAAEDLLRGAGAVDVGGVPRSSAWRKIGCAVSSSTAQGITSRGVPKLMQPSTMRLTFSPDVPRFV